MKQTKHSRKSKAQNLCSKCPPFTPTHAFKFQTTTPLCNRCRDDGVVQQPPLAQQTFFQLLHIMDPRTVDPLLKDTQNARSTGFKSGELGGHISGGIKSGSIWIDPLLDTPQRRVQQSIH